MINSAGLEIVDIDGAFNLIAKIRAKNSGDAIAKEDKKEYFLALNYIDEHLEELEIEQIEKLLSPEFEHSKRYLKTKSAILKEMKMEHYIRVKSLYPNDIDLEGLKRGKKEFLVARYLTVLYQKPNISQFKHLLGEYENIVIKSFCENNQKMPEQFIEVVMEQAPQLIFNKTYTENYNSARAENFFNTVWNKKFDAKNNLILEGMLIKNVVKIQNTLNEEILDIYLNYLIKQLEKIDSHEVEAMLDESSALAYTPILSVPQFLKKINEEKPELINKILNQKVKIKKKIYYDEWGNPNGKESTSILNLAQFYFISHEFYFDLALEQERTSAEIFLKLFIDNVMDNRCYQTVEFLAKESDFFDYFYEQENIHRQIMKIDYDRLNDSQKDKFIAKVFYFLNMDLKKMAEEGSTIDEELGLQNWATKILPTLEADKVCAMYEKTKDEHNEHSIAIIESIYLKHKIGQAIDVSSAKAKGLKI